MITYITPQDQMLVIEKLYRSNDSITSTRKFNDTFGTEIGKIAEKSLPINNFYHMLVDAKFLRYRIKEYIQEITGETIELY